MPFSIRDDEIKTLADELRALTGANNRSVAIKNALKAQIKIAKRSTPLEHRLIGFQNRAAALHASGSKGQ